MENPWMDMPDENPFVLSDDKKSIDDFNRRVVGGPQVIDASIPPEPFLGLWTAPVVLLMANPGRDRRDDDMFRQPRVRDANRDSMEAPGVPIYNLWNELTGTPSGGWWRSLLAGLLAPSRDYSVIAERIFVVEHHGYHSEKSSVGAAMPSQKFGFDLVSQAIDSRKVIII